MLKYAEPSSSDVMCRLTSPVGHTLALEGFDSQGIHRWKWVLMNQVDDEVVDACGHLLLSDSISCFV